MNITPTILERMNSYRGKRVLITGHTGFTGSWLGLWLSALGAQVTGYAIEPPTQPNLFSVLHLEDDIVSIFGSVLDCDRLNSVVHQYGPEIIFHLAAIPIVRRSYQAPRETYEVNVMGTVNVLESIRFHESVRAVVIVTSEKCYRIDGVRTVFHEDDPKGGHDPYSSSKACVEILSDSWRSSYFTPSQPGHRMVGVGTVRPSNIIGGGDWSADRLIPDCIRALSGHLPVSIRNPSHLRPWQYMLNPLYGYLLLGSHLLEDPATYSGGYNMGAPQTDLRTVESMVRAVIELWGTGEYRIDDLPEEPYEEKSLFMDCEKAATLLGWRPLFDLAYGLPDTVSWYRTYFQNKDGGDLVEYSVSRIRSAMQRIETLSHPCA